MKIIIVAALAALSVMAQVAPPEKQAAKPSTESVQKYQDDIRRFNDLQSELVKSATKEQKQIQEKADNLKKELDVLNEKAKNMRTPDQKAKQSEAKNLLEMINNKDKAEMEKSCGGMAIVAEIGTSTMLCGHTKATVN